MLLFEKVFKINEKDSKKNIFFPFTVPCGVKALEADFSYNPKTVESKEKALQLINDGFRRYGIEGESPENELPVDNLLTLSFDDIKGYRGACHRHPNEQHIIIGEQSTYGIINRPVTAGGWRACLNVHFAGCEIEVSIRIKGVEV